MGKTIDPLRLYLGPGSSRFHMHVNKKIKNRLKQSYKEFIRAKIVEHDGFQYQQHKDCHENRRTNILAN